MVVFHLVIVAIVMILNLSPKHMIKGHVIGRLGTVSSFPQNLVHVQYPL